MTSPRRLCRDIAKLLTATMVLAVAGCGSDRSLGSGVQNLLELPNDELAMLKVADASRDGGDCEAAVRFYRLAVNKAKDPVHEAQARIGAADCELNIGAVAAAEQDYRAAIAAAPKDGAGYLGLGRVYLIAHRPDEGLRYFDLAIKKGADTASAWNDMGVALDELHRHRDAQHYYRSGLGKYPADHALRNNLALSLAMAGDFGEAETIMRALLSEPGATARTRENLALILGLAGDDAGARQVSRADLDDAALDNNSRYYRQIRDATADASPKTMGAAGADIGLAADHPPAMPAQPVSATILPAPPKKPVQAAPLPAQAHDRKVVSRAAHRHPKKSRAAARSHRKAAVHGHVAAVPTAWHSGRHHHAPAAGAAALVRRPVHHTANKLLPS